MATNKTYTVKESDLHYVILYRDEIPCWEDYCKALGESPDCEALKLIVLDSEPYKEV